MNARAHINGCAGIFSATALGRCVLCAVFLFTGCGEQGGGGSSIAGNSITGNNTASASLTLLAGTLGGPGDADGGAEEARTQAMPLGGLLVDADKNIYFVNKTTSHLSLRKITLQSNVTTLARLPETINGQPIASISATLLGIDRSGRLLVRHDYRLLQSMEALPYDYRYWLIAADGSMSLLPDIPEKLRDPAQTTALLSDDGDAYFIEYCRIAHLQDGQWQVIAGSAGLCSTDNATASATRHDASIAALIDSMGNILLLSRSGTVLQRITGNGEVTSLTNALPEGISNIEQLLGFDDSGNILAYALEPYSENANALHTLRIATAGTITVIPSTQLPCHKENTFPPLAQKSLCLAQTDGAIYAWPTYGVMPATPLAATQPSSPGFIHGFLPDRVNSRFWAGSPPDQGTSATSLALHLFDLDGHTIGTRELALSSPQTSQTVLPDTINTPSLADAAVDASANIYTLGLHIEGGQYFNRLYRQNTDGNTSLIVSAPIQGAANAPTWHKLRLHTDGCLYVIDARAHVIQRINPNNGRISTLSAGLSTQAGEPLIFESPSDLASGLQGNLYVVDNGRVKQITASGQVILWRSSPVATIAVDTAGMLYLGGRDTSDLTMLDPATGRQQTLIAFTGAYGVRLGTSPRLNLIRQLAFDGAGGLLIASENATLRYH